MTKTVKVFGVGKWNNKEFSKTDVEKLIENTKGSVKAIFAHTSKWLKEGKEPVSLGEFSNVRLQDNDVLADLELNEKGNEYHTDGIIKGISAEVTDSFARIAMLPIGVNQAVEGAEFAEQVMEFEIIDNKEEGGEKVVDISKMNLEEKLETVKLIGESITPDQKKTIRVIGYEFAEVPKNVIEALESGAEFEIKKPLKEKTREDYRLEFEAEANEKKLKEEKEGIITGEIKKLKEDMKLTPAEEKEFEAILKTCDHSEKNDTLEFEEDGKTVVKKSQLERVVEFSKKALKSKKHLLKSVEFGKVEKTDIDKYNDQIKGK